MKRMLQLLYRRLFKRNRVRYWIRFSVAPPMRIPSPYVPALPEKIGEFEVTYTA